MNASAPTEPLAPLHGVKVLDFTQFLSGPFCTMILADMGAEVIKLEGPEGDLARHIPPHFIGNDSVYYLSINRSKRSVGIDLKQPAGLELARRLCTTCDVVVENFRPGVLERLGLSVSALRGEHPELIWCSISGFGQDGPYRNKPAYDMIVQAISGGMSLTGTPEGKPVRAGIPIADLAAGMYAAIAVLGAVLARHRSGRGDSLDISMLDCQAAMLSYQAAYYLHSGQVPGRQGSAHDSIPTYRTFTAHDGVEVVITANTEKMWQGLCRAIGREDLLTQARFATNRERYANRHELWPLLEEEFAKRAATEWIERLEAQEVPAGMVNTIDRVAADPQIQHRRMVQSLSSDGDRAARVVASPLRFADTPLPTATFPPTLGEHTAEILTQTLGLTAAEIDALQRSGAIHGVNKGEV